MKLPYTTFHINVECGRMRVGKGGEMMTYIAMKTRLNLPLEQRRFLQFLMREGRSLYNQRTKSIPLARLRDRIIYLAEQEGIETRIVNEAYTSKASYMDGDTLSKSEFSGRRLKRGLYQTKSSRLINADQNAALNMIQKGNPNAVRIGTKGVNTPKRTCLFGV